MSDDDLFDKLGMKVEQAEVEVGKAYPLYGIITGIIDESVEKFTIEINHGIILRCQIKDTNSVNTIKERAFEPGIFVAEITNLKPVEGNCTTIVFGKKHTEEIT